MNRLEETYGEHVHFLYLNANEDGKTAFEIGRFPGHPAVVLLATDGEEVWRKFGVISFAEMEKQIQSILP